MIGGIRSVLCVPVFQGLLRVIVIMIEGSVKRNCQGVTVGVFLKRAVRKCMKSWLSQQGISGRRVTLPSVNVSP